MEAVMVPKDSSEGASLADNHSELIAASAIDPEVANQRGYFTATRKNQLAALSFPPSQQLVPSLVNPVWGVSGEIVGYQLRPDRPRIDRKSGKPRKYETLAGMRMALDVPPRCRPLISDPNVPLFITEGSRKADAAASQGLCCVALLGVWSWRGSNERSGLTALADWEWIALNGREVYIAFDSDVMLKREVYGALVRLKELLESRGAIVRLVYLPAGPHGEKVGLDDWIAARADGKLRGDTIRSDILGLVRGELPAGPEPEPDSGLRGPYVEQDGHLYYRKLTPEGSTDILLADFTARIVADVSRDDGTELIREFEIEVLKGGSAAAKAMVPGAQFGSMNWLVERFGADAIVSAGIGTKDRVREAIQRFSMPIPKRIEYAHTGWRKLDGGWLYLHADGAIGADGARADVRTILPNALAPMVLPAPPERGVELSRMVSAGLALLEVAPERITVPLLAAVWRAVLDRSNLTIFLLGKTGAYKTSLAALAQAFFGAEFNAETLPGQWASTANFLEGLSFVAKDTLLVIDDFKPGGSIVDRQRLNSEADRLFRAQANGGGRSRMRSDGTLRPLKPPRGTLLSTGEDRPSGESLDARLLFVEMHQGEVDRAKLTSCQHDAAAGLYAGATAAFIRWLAPRLDDVRTAIKDSHPDYRDSMAEVAAGSNMHPRTPGIVADLMLGADCFVAFAANIGALLPDKARGLRIRIWCGLMEAAFAQLVHQRQTNPVHRFVELLGSAIASGSAHVARREDGGEPENDRAWGWREDVATGTRPQGARVGWVDGDDLYLDADAAYRAAQAMAVENGIAVSVHTLTKRLHGAGMLASIQGKGELKVRRTIEGREQTRVLHLRATLPSLSNKFDLSDIPDNDADFGANSVNRPPEMSVFLSRFLADPTVKGADNSRAPSPDVANVELFQRERPTALNGATDDVSECRDFQDGSLDSTSKSDISAISDSQACELIGNPRSATDAPRPADGKNDEGVLA
jgi:uncharacterized protein DUF3854